MSKGKIITKAKDDLLFFGRAVAPSMFTVKSAAFHKELSDHLLDKSLRYMSIQAPRGHAKSSIAAGLLPLHHIIYDKGTKFIVLISKTRDHSAKLLQTIKDTLEYSDHFRALYGYWGRHKAMTWGKWEVELRDPRTGDRTYILCRGANQQMRGLKYVNQRPTLVVYDDPEDEQNTKTEESMANTLDGLYKGIMPGLDAQRGRCVVIGTPIHAQGLVNTLEEDGRWLSLHYHALIDTSEPENTKFQPRRENKHRYKALWPEVWGVDRLLQEFESVDKMGRPSSFYSEYQCEIVGDQDQIFPEKNFRYWKGSFNRDLEKNAYLEVTHMGREMEALEKPELVPVNVFMGVDPASSTARTADYSVVFVLALDAQKNVYCLDYFRERVKPMDLADAIVNYYRKYRPNKTQIETVGYQEMLRNYLREHVPEHIPGLEIKNNPRRGKTERLESLQPEFAMGKVYIRPDMTEFMDELQLFPRAKNDDTLDGLYYARKGAYRPYHDVILKENPNREQFQLQRQFRDWMVV